MPPTEPATPTPRPDGPPRWLRAWWPAAQAVDRRERLRVAVGAGLGLLVAGALGQATLWWLGLLGPWALTLPASAAALPWLVAPLGASAVLVYGLPASPLAQPWAVVGGNTVSALVGIAVAAWLPWPVLAAPLAVALAIAAMFALRCLHPPGGASALLMVLAGYAQFRYAWFPVMANSLLLVAVGVAYNRATGRRYPHAQLAAAPPQAGVPGAPRFDEADIDAAMQSFNQLSHVPRDDLQAMLEQAELHAHGRRLSALRCSDVMTREPVTVHFGSALQEAWALLRDHHIKALPVVDRARRVVGIVTLADFMRGADLDLHHGFDERLKRLIRATPFSHSDKPEVVGQIMTRSVRVAGAGRSLAELVTVFSATGHHHIPIVDDEARLVGIVTQTDLVRALLRFAVR